VARHKIWFDVTLADPFELKAGALTVVSKLLERRSLFDKEDLAGGLALWPSARAK